jgi:hypothetical protein
MDHLMKYQIGEEITCPLATAHEPVWDDVPAGIVVGPGRRVKFAGLPPMRVPMPTPAIEASINPDGTLIAAVPEFVPEPFVAPTGTQIEREQPAEGKRHTAVFEALPDGYATKRWGGARKEEPYLRCPVCTATFPAWGIEESLQK